MKTDGGWRIDEWRMKDGGLTDGVWRMKDGGLTYDEYFMRNTWGKYKFQLFRYVKIEAFAIR